MEKLVGERKFMQNTFAQMRLTKKRWCATKRYKIKKLAYTRLVVETTRMEKRTSPNKV